jgi:hypothetical protein
MVRRRPSDDDGVAREPFDRSPATWRRLGAPAQLYDETLAAATWRSYAPRGYRLDGDQLDPSGARELLAHRHWRWARPAFLAEVDGLTPHEASLLERFPKFYAPPTWPRAAI